MIGRFPWEPFPQEEPEPKGPDPVPRGAFQAAVTAADAYRSVRAALRREEGVLRVGNRFVADWRYRQVAFVAIGNAANSMALGALHAVGDRLTQGFLAGPERWWTNFRSEASRSPWACRDSLGPRRRSARYRRSRTASAPRTSSSFSFRRAPSARSRSPLPESRGRSSPGSSGTLRPPARRVARSVCSPASSARAAWGDGSQRCAAGATPRRS